MSQPGPTSNPLAALAAAARAEADESADDARWEALAAGTLPEDERQALEARAQTDPYVRHMLDLLAPRDAAADAEKYAARAGAVYAAEASAGAAPSTAGSVANASPPRAAEVTAAPEPKSAAVVALADARGRRPPVALRRIALFFTPVAAAAAVVLWLRTSGPGDLPAYELAAEGGEEELRGSSEPSRTGPATVLRVKPGTRVEFVVRPAVAVDGDVDVRAFLVRQGESRAWTPPYERSSDGAFRIVGPARALFGPSEGELDVVLVVGRPAALPKTYEEARALRARSNGPTRVFEQRVVLGNGT
jgi:hypothetical protein